jgi:ketosteroid isomerase-like protein
VVFKTTEIKKENPMKRMAFVVSALVLVLTATGWAQNTAQTKSGSAEQEILKLEREWTDAIVKGDIAFRERIYAPDIFITDNDGVLWTRAQDIASLKAGETVYTVCVTDNIKVHVYGDTAVVTGRNTEKGKTKGKDFSRLVQWTDTWVKIAGRWQVVATQGTVIAQK